jgi:hypothetical protein
VKINSGPLSDNAGNTNPGIDSAAFKIDQTAPVVAYKSASPAANANGWNNTNVTATFEATDSLSGMGATDADKTATNTATTSGEGTNVSVGSPAFTDRAGNIALADAATSPDFKIDLTNPLVSLAGGPANNGSYYFGSVPNSPTCTASDALSLLAGPCTVNGYGTTVGSHTVSASATDNADNTATTASRTYTVLGWTLLGFKSPFDMGIYNDAKGGSTVPLKFEVFAGPTELTSTSVVDYFTQKVNCASGEGDAIEQYSTGNTELRYDTTSGQFIFNWKTPKAPGSCYRVTLQTDDGAQIYADFRLK